MVYILGSAAGTAVAAGGTIPFNAANPNNSPSATLSGSGLRLANGGIYQVTFGVEFVTVGGGGGAASRFNLLVSGVASVENQLEVNQTTASTRNMHVLTTIVRASAGAILTVTSTSARTLNNSSATAVSVVAFITAFRLE